MLLDLPVLDGNSSEGVVQLYGLDGRCSVLVLRRLRAQPEMEVPNQTAAALRRLEKRKESKLFLKEFFF